MGEKERLIDLLQRELNQMETEQIKAFKSELQKQLPGFIHKTAEDAKRASKESEDRNTCP